MIFDIVPHVEDAQSLLLVAPGQAFPIEYGQVDVAFQLVPQHFRMEHASDVVGLCSWPEEEFLLLIGLHFEGEGLIGEEIRHVLGEFQHVFLLLFVLFLDLVFSVSGVVAKGLCLFGCGTDVVHGVEVSLEIYIDHIGGRLLMGDED